MDMEVGCPPSPTPGDASQETDYVPIRVLGRGAFGEAVLYRKVMDNTLVVWKEVDLKRLNDKERRDAETEIEILSILNHANIVSYYNHFLDGETLLIEMEYANGGTLYHKIGAQTDLLSEEMVLWYFYQMISAVIDIHENGILHRDIKTLNIFLTKSNLIKLGDFGISKMLDSKSKMAESYVGTPYYMSPELIRGDPYDQKSDIWAAGCVLYELLTLTKVFDATNPLKLAAHIVRSDFEDISAKYSQDTRKLVHDMLDKNPKNRPYAEDILNYPIYAGKTQDLENKVWNLNSETRKHKMSVSQHPQDVLPVVTSKSTEVYFWGGGKQTPQKVEIFSKGKSALQVEAGHGHFAVLTVEKELFTWTGGQSGIDMVGQLGHGDTAAYKAPKKVAAFEDVQLRQVSCGQEFTVAVAENGNAYAFGSDYYGCLGCDNAEGDEVCTPTLIDFFSTRLIDHVSCGDAHVVALTNAGEVYTWGCGEFGRLGLGSEDDYATPQQVKTRGKHGIRSVHAGSDGTFLVKTNGRVLACGSNEFNKLGFNNTAQGVRKKQMSYDLPCKPTFTTVRPLCKYHIVAVSAGRTHSAVIDRYGHLLMFGSNRFGQLGVGDYKPRQGITMLGGPLTGKQVTRVSCGDGFTAAATAENQIYSWGLAENGRLGTTAHDSGAGKGPGGQSFSLPRTLFGSLHAVSDLSSKYWNTILVAEKVLAQKTIRSTSVPGTSRSSVLPFIPDEASIEGTENGSGASNDSGTSDHQLGESTVPAWLADELKDSEFIPQGNGAVEKADEDSTPAWLRDELDNADVIPALPETPPPSAINISSSGSAQLYSSTAEIEIGDYVEKNTSEEVERLEALAKALENENTTLKDENCRVVCECSRVKDELNDLKAEMEEARQTISSLTEEKRDMSEHVQKLQELVDCQADTIRAQAESLSHLEDKNQFHRDIEDEVWSVMERWQTEITEAASISAAHLQDIRRDQPRVALPSSITGTYQEQKVRLREISLDCRYLENRLSLTNGSDVDGLEEWGTPGQGGCADDKPLSWDNLGSPDESKAWSRSGRSDMMKSFTPGTITKVLKGVTTTEEIV